MFSDLQETFSLVLGPYLAYILLPIFIAAGLLTSALIAVRAIFRRKIF